jgi:hypothetical protein
MIFERCVIALFGSVDFELIRFRLTANPGGGHRVSILDQWRLSF